MELARDGNCVVLSNPKPGTPVVPEGTLGRCAWIICYRQPRDLTDKYVSDLQATVGNTSTQSDNTGRSITTRIVRVDHHVDAGVAFDVLGDVLVTGHTRVEVIDLYNKQFHFEDEQLEPGITSRMITQYGVITLCFDVLSVT